MIQKQKKKTLFCQVSWYTHTHTHNPSIHRLRQENCHKFKSILDYRVSSGLTWATEWDSKTSHLKITRQCPAQFGKLNGLEQENVLKRGPFDGTAGCLISPHHRINSKKYQDQAWWCAPLMPILSRQRQEDLCEFRANLVYISRISRAT